jgi:hypothetical protein
MPASSVKRERRDDPCDRQECCRMALLGTGGSKVRAARCGRA